MPEITVLGVGNILLQDEGFGVRVIEAIREMYRFIPDIQVLDGGTLGLELLPYLIDTDKLIIVDAVAGSLAPGEFYHFRHTEAAAYFNASLSLHELGIREVLAGLEILEKPVTDLVVFGIQPASLKTGLELSTLIKSKVMPMTKNIIEQLQDWNVEVRPLEEH